MAIFRWMTLALAAVFSLPVLAAQEGFARVELQGTLHQDNNGTFVRAGGQIYDIELTGRDDMRNMALQFRDSNVHVTGKLRVEEVANARPRLIVEPERIAQLGGENVRYERTEIRREEPVVRERIIREGDDDGHFKIPGLEIDW